MATEHLTRAELGRALGLEAGEGALPVTARSLTQAEARARDGRKLLWLVVAYALLAAACIAVLLLADTRPMTVRWLPWGFALAAVGIAVVGWFALRPSRAYRDPGMTVAVEEGGIAVTDATGARRYRYDQLEIARIVTRTAPGSVYFEGVDLTTPDGNLLIGDPGFADGNSAAGAILRQLEQRDVETAQAA